MKISRLNPKNGYWRTLDRRSEGIEKYVEQVREKGDEALLKLTKRFDGAALTAEDLRVDPAGSAATLPDDVVAGLRTAIANVRAVAEAQLRTPVAVDLPEGQHVEIEDMPVRRAGIYAPGGKAVYPSSVVMGVVTAQASGVPEVAVCSPPNREGAAHPSILAACELCGVDEVYLMGGPQAIAAFAYGTDTVEAVDVIAGPGNGYVQEAKRAVASDVAIDGIAGPSELVALVTAGADAELVALDLLAQAEHGFESEVWVVSPDAGLLDQVVERVEAMATDRPTATAHSLAVCDTDDLDHAVRVVDGLAPEHLELMGEDAEALADRPWIAGAVFVGNLAATAFGDYVAGSNHVLPTGRAARFQGALSPATFRRPMARVTLTPEAASKLAAAGAPLARAEGFPVHAESMERRA